MGEMYGDSWSLWLPAALCAALDLGQAGAGGLFIHKVGLARSHDLLLCLCLMLRGGGACSVSKSWGIEHPVALCRFDY